MYHIFRALNAEAAGQRRIVAEEVRKVERLAPGFTVDGWLSIVGIRDEATLERLRHLAIAAGLRP
jgi:hypothetical protein